MAYSIIIALLAVASCVVSVAAQQRVFGGASSFEAYGPAIVRAYKNQIPPYASVGSGAGIRGFTDGTYLIGASDDPLTAAQDAAAGGNSKFHLPLTLATYSFVTRKAQGLRITGSQAARIYLGQITRWSDIKAGLSGNIVPVGRSDGSGTTAVVGSYLREEFSGFPLAATGTASWSTVAGISGSTVYARGSSGVASACQRNVNAITYIQSGIGITQFRLFGMQLQNRARTYLLATRADPAQSIPRSLPPSDGVWAGVNLLNKSGKDTYPLVSFIYMFAKKKYATTSQGTTVRNFLTFTMGNTAQNLAKSYFFFRIPSTVVNKNLAAIRTIK